MQDNPLIHPFAVNTYPWQGHGGLEPIPAALGREAGSPWIGCQFITGLTHKDNQPFTHTFTPTGNLESPINLTCMSLDCGRKLERQERAQADMGRTTPRRKANDGANHCTTVPPIRDSCF